MTDPVEEYFLTTLEDGPGLTGIHPVAQLPNRTVRPEEVLDITARYWSLVTWERKQQEGGRS